MPRTKTKKPAQLALELRTWGGKRRGAGRKRQGPRARVPHRDRPRFGRPAPVHVTIRFRAEVWNLRSGRMFRRILEAMARQLASERAPLVVVHFSVQANHIHFIVEPESSTALSRAVKGFARRIAHTLNRLMRRSGPVFDDRFHAHVLDTPREARNAVAYVLGNHASHAERLGLPAPAACDPCSSAAAPREGLVCTAPARTWLLRRAGEPIQPPRTE